MPNSFPQSKENSDFNYSFLITTLDGEPGTQANQPWTAGQAPDGRGEFNVKIAEPLGYVPSLGFGRPDTFGQKEQTAGTAVGMLEKGKDLISKLAHPNG